MGGQKFQYDESGSKFLYVLISFLMLFLIPGTYYFWPKISKEGMYNKWIHSELSKNHKI